jgi:hypothetical protein
MHVTDAAAALAAALPASLQAVLCVDVRAPLSAAEPRLAPFAAAAAAARCAALQVVELGSWRSNRRCAAIRHDHVVSAVDCANARAADARLLGPLRRALPGAHATLRGYSNLGITIDGGLKIPSVPEDMPGCARSAAAVWARSSGRFPGPQGWGFNGEGW